MNDEATHPTADSSHVQEPSRDGSRRPPAGEAPASLASRSSNAIPNHPDARRFPLSFSQQRLWFLYQLDPNDPSYLMQSAIRLRGPLDADRLGRSFEALVDRHEALRTRFDADLGEPFQEVLSGRGQPMGIVDLTSKPEEERERIVRLRAADLARTPFRLEDGHLYRIVLFALRPDEHILVVTLHHIIADNWTWGILTRELGELYRSYIEGKPVQLPTLTHRFGGYAIWQRARCEAAEVQRSLAYWKQRLEGAPTCLELPTDRPRPAVRTYHGDRVSLPLQDDLVTSFRRFCRKRGVTLFMGLLAAYEVWLSRYSQETDVVVGSPVAGRLAWELESIAGMFVNNVVLRGDLSDNPSFEDYLHRVKSSVLEALEHQEVPFERVLEELNPVRSLAYSPLFQTMFILQSMGESPGLPGVSWEPMNLAPMTAKFDCTLEVWPVGNGLRLDFEYNTDLFGRDTADRLLRNYRALLYSILEKPATRVLDLDILDATERQAVERWNRTNAPIPDLCVYELFERQARATPERVALSFQNEEITYGELDRRAGTQACRLRASGAGPDVPVAVCLERSIDLVVALLAVLKAGSGYVPIDPSLPQDRIRYMLEDLGHVLLVTTHQLANDLGIRGRQTVFIDDGSSCVQEQDVLPSTPARASNLAYVIYTSGSTGRPKGVATEHRAMVNLLLGMQDLLRFGREDVLLSVTTVSFDIFVVELFLPLCIGAKTVLVTRDVARDGFALAEALQTSGATWLQATPSGWRVLLSSGWGGNKKLNALCGGEPLSPDLAAELCGRVGTLWNAYGPTETTVWSTAERVDDPADVTIGRPLRNTRVYIMDERGSLVPIGVPGEICIAGKGVARGYHGRPELTAEKFVPDRFSPGPSARMYRTGDRGRYRSDGRLECLGRFDHQVKIRGHRIELGEIENRLSGHEGVRQCVVTVRTDAAAARAEPVLVAYYVPRASLVEVDALRKHLQKFLPEHMVPERFVVLSELPRTPNGKVDRKALPAPPSEEGAAVHSSDAAPATAMERTVADVWAEVLSRKPGRADDFFALGGHSLLAMQVAARLRERLGRAVEVRTLLAHPVLRDLAAILETLGDAGSLPVLRRQARSGPVPVSYQQLPLWLLARLNPAGAMYNLCFAYRMVGPLSRSTLCAAIQAVVARHESLRTTFAIEQGPVQVVHEQMAIALQTTDLRGASPEARQEAAVSLIRLEATVPFDIETGPLVRAQLLHLADEEHVLALTIHHLICDGWSLGVLTRDLAEAYHRIEHRDVPDPARSTAQYADFTLWQRECYPETSLREFLAFWKEELAGAKPFLRLPTDCERPSIQRNQGSRHFFRWSKELSKRIKALAREHDATLFTVLMAGFLALLHQQTGETDILVGAPVAHRGHPELQNMIGCLVDTMVLRGDLSGDPSFGIIVVRVRERLLRALARSVLPLDRIVDALGIQRDLSRSPLFQVMLEMHDGDTQPTAETEANGATFFLPLPIDIKTSQYDLLLSIQDEGEALSGNVQYDTDLFRQQTIVGWVERLEAILSAATADSKTPISQWLGTSIPHSDSDSARPDRAPTNHRTSRDTTKPPIEPAPTPPELPMVRRDHEPGVHRDVITYSMDATRWKRLMQEAKRHDLTAEVVWLGAYAHVLAYWSRTQSFSIGIEKEGEPQRSIAVDFSPAATFVDRARAFAKKLPARPPAPGPVEVHPLPVAFLGAVREAPASGRRPLERNGASQPWLDHWIVEREGEFEFGWSCLTEVFPARLPADLISAHQNLLERLSRASATWTQTMPVELPVRQLQIRNRVNDTAGAIPRGLLHSGFMRHAKQQPECVAVIASDRELRYGELDRLTNRIARRLRDLGAAPNGLVAIAAEKGWEQIAAILGILKSGGGYVPIDPSWPAERIRSVLAQAEVDLVLTQERFLHSPKWPEQTTPLAVDDPAEWQDSSDADVDVRQTGEDVAYVLFTSGSTGKPKGVVLNHTSPVNTIHDFNQRFRLSPDDRVLALSAITFDLSVYDIFGILTAGGAIVVPTTEATRDPEQWTALMNRHKVTVWNSVPMFMQMLIEHLSSGRHAPAGLRLVLLSGDWIPVSLPDRIRGLFRGAEVWASGGPTETFYSIIYKVEAVDPSWNSIPYGKPLTNQRIYVLNDRMQPCPEWVPGRMYVGGISLARGYLHDPIQTELRFIKHPKSGEPLYWTGDLGRFLPGGDVEFLGREDHQVKVQGHRIELGEIETHLLEHPGVEAVAVTAEPSANGSTHLVCYYVPRSNDAVDSGGLTEHLRLRLPEYMVPSAWVSLAALPLTPNGKVDRRALASIGVPRECRAGLTGPVGPRNGTERELVDLWSQVLRVDGIGVHDDFFALGGNSLTCILVVERARRIGIDITPRELFIHRTISELAAAMAARRSPDSSTHDGIGEQPLTTLQRWFFSVAPERRHPERWNVNVLLELRAPFDPHAFERAVLAIVNHHDGLRARFERAGDGRRQVIEPPWKDAPFQVVDLSAIPEALRETELERRCDELQNHYDFESGRLIQFVFFQLDRTRPGRLWINAHHLVIDGMSLGIVLEDLREAYAGFREGRAIRLAGKGTSIGGWTKALEEWTKADLVRKERDYWLGLPWHEIELLPADAGKDRDRCTVDSIREHMMQLDEQQSAFILYEMPKRQGLSPEDVLIGALIQSLAKWTGHVWQDIMALNSGRDRMMADRPDLDISRTVGWVSAERVLVLRRSTHSDPLEAVRDIQLQLAQIPHGGHGYNLLRFLSGDRRLAETLAALRKRPGVLFNFQGPRSLDVPGYGPYAQENPGYDEPEQNLRFNLFECHVLVVRERIQIRWRFSANVHDVSTVSRVARDFGEFLEGVVASGRQISKSSKPTPTSADPHANKKSAGRN